uniref:Tyrosine-protein kinase n=1 Tax=Panagrellus redivivus TaxID=6233 RepID=A0A7E4UWQ0_PANRE
MASGNPTDPEDQMKKVHGMNCYHGLRSRIDIESEMIEKGDFLIRMVKQRKSEVVLSVCLGNENKEQRIAHLPVAYNPATKGWELGLLFTKRKRGRNSTVETPSSSAGPMGKPGGKVITFSSMEELIRFYRKRQIVSGTLLKTPIKRPKWLITTTALKFDLNKDFLGSGNFCHVVRGRLKGRPDKIVAIKMLKDDDDAPTSPNDVDRDEGRDSMFREAQIMARCRHKHVIRFYGLACDVPPVMIVMEFCPGGSLENHLQNEKENVTVGERILFCFEAARGMRYLHHHGFVHRDLACRNCLISSDGVVKISDFGLSRTIDKMEKNILLSQDVPLKNVPLRWMAPEALSRKPEFTTKSDVWSFGVLMYEVFNLGIKPWVDETDNKKIFACIKKNNMPEMPDRTPSGIKDVVKRCWCDKQTDRPEFREVLKLIAKVQNSEPKYKPPKAAECSTNRLPGVIREETTEINTEELNAEKSICVFSEQNRTPPQSRGTSEETASRESRESRDSAEDVRGVRHLRRKLNFQRSPVEHKKSTH